MKERIIGIHMDITILKKKQFAKDFLWVVLILLFATLAAAFDHRFKRVNIVSTYILAIVIVARVTSGYLWGLIASFLAVLCVNFLFTYPYLTFDFTLNGYPITFVIMSLTALLVNLTTAELKEHAKNALIKERNTQELYVIMKELIALDTSTSVIELMVSHLRNYLCTTVEYEHFPNPEHYVGMHRPWYYSPLLTSNKYYGTLAIKINNMEIAPREFQRFMELLSAQTVLTLEQLRLKEEQRITLLDSEKEKMRSNLLRAISHDLRTPLTNMLGSTSTLLDNGSVIDRENQIQLLTSVHDDCQWLIHMVENLLSVTRIQEGETKLKTTMEPAEEIIAEAVSKLKKRCPNTIFHVKVPDELLMVPMDATLIEQVIINLAENSVQHSGCPSPIDITLSHSEEKAVFEIRDYGRGLLPEQLTHLFDGYGTYSNKSQDTYKGMGIGLSICMTIIKAHNGTLNGFNKEDEKGGASFLFALPMEDINL